MALSLPEQGLSALPGLCGPVRPWQSAQAAPRPHCWMGSMVWAASRGRRRPVWRAGACSGVTVGPNAAFARSSSNFTEQLWEADGDIYWLSWLIICPARRPGELFGGSGELGEAVPDH